MMKTFDEAEQEVIQQELDEKDKRIAELEECESNFLSAVKERETLKDRIKELEKQEYIWQEYCRIILDGIEWPKEYSSMMLANRLAMVMYDIGKLHMIQARIAELEAEIVSIRQGHKLANEQHCRLAIAFQESTDQYLDVFTDHVIAKYAELEICTTCDHTIRPEGRLCSRCIQELLDEHADTLRARIDAAVEIFPLCADRDSDVPFSDLLKILTGETKKGGG